MSESRFTSFFFERSRRTSPPANYINLFNPQSEIGNPKSPAFQIVKSHYPSRIKLGKNIILDSCFRRNDAYGAQVARLRAFPAARTSPARTFLFEPCTFMNETGSQLHMICHINFGGIRVQRADAENVGVIIYDLPQFATGFEFLVSSYVEKII
jgi:hypothetical protein